MEAPGPDRRRPGRGRQELEADELAQAQRTIEELEAELEIVQGGRRALQRRGAGQPKRRCQVAQGLSNLGYSERAPVGSWGWRARATTSSSSTSRATARSAGSFSADPVADIHQRPRGTYGMLRIRAALMREHDMIVNKKLVLSIMRELGIQGLPGPKKHKKNLINMATEEDLVQRNFTADEAQRALADRHHRTPDARGQGLLLRRPRPLQPQGRRLGHRPALRDRTRQRRLVMAERLDGRPASTRSSTPTTAASSPRGPSPSTSAPGPHGLDGHGRRLLRQRPDGVVLGLDADRAAQSQEVADQDRTARSPWPTTSSTSTTQPGATAP